MTSQRIQRAVIIATTLLAAGTLWIPEAAAGPPPLPAPPPPGAARVHVAAGELTRHIDVALPPNALGNISGRVLESGSKRPLKYLLVRAYSPSGHALTQNLTYRDGRYTLFDLPASRRGYVVCFGGSDTFSTGPAFGGRSTTGWAPECYRNQVWSGLDASVPAHTTRVRVVAEQETQHVNARLAPGGAISGKVVRRTGTRPIGTVVFVRSVGAPHYHRTISTDFRTGHYRVAGLPPAPGGYQVCFDNNNRNTSTRIGHVSQCYRDVVWRHPPRLNEGVKEPLHWPSAATRISVPSGTQRHGIGARLRVAGAVSGRVVDRASGDPLDAPAEIRIYDRAGRLAGSGYNDGGRFTVGGLPPAAYFVCVWPVRYHLARIHSPNSNQRGCYPNSRWTGPASRTTGTPVHVSRGKTHKHVVIALRRASTIQGRLTSAANGQPVRGRVYLYTRAGKYLQSENTSLTAGRAGKYLFVGVPAAHAGYLVCASAFRLDDLTEPWLRPECYGQARWDGAASAPAKRATPIRVGTKTHRRNRDIALHAGGAISGDATEIGPHRLSAQIYLVDDAGQLVAQTRNFATPRWSIAGLDPARTYRICVERLGGRRGFKPTCYRHALWYRPWVD